MMVDIKQGTTITPPDFLDWLDTNEYGFNLFSKDTVNIREEIIKISREHLLKRKKRFKAKKEVSTIKTETTSKLILISKRSKRLNKDTRCSNCGTTHNPVWEYSDSNLGKVLICDYCKPGLVEKAFGKKPSRPFILIGGGFETNRRKH